MTPTTDELRALVERLDSVDIAYVKTIDDGDVIYRLDDTPKDAAAALRLWITEREREPLRIDDLVGMDCMEGDQ